MLNNVAAWSLAMVVLWQPEQAHAQAPAKSSLDGIFKAIAKEDYTEAKRQADALLTTAAPADRLKVSLAYGKLPHANREGYNVPDNYPLAQPYTLYVSAKAGQTAKDFADWLAANLDAKTQTEQHLVP